jgi:response regulator RpfG family c-di-GMP phosphodiesterase
MKSDSVLFIAQNLSIVEKLLTSFQEYSIQTDISHALSIEEALKSLKISPFDILIIDITEISIEHKEIIDSLRTHSINKNLSIVAICKQQIRNHCISIGFDDCIIFPFEKEEFDTTLGKILVRKSTTQQTTTTTPESVSLTEEYITITKELLALRIPSFDETLTSIERISLWIAKEFEDFSEVELQHLRYSSTLWSIGKLVLPDTAIRLPSTKNGFLQEEYMTQIPVVTVATLKNKPYFSNVIPIVEALFENFDGTGFPNGYQGWQIPLTSRLLRVVVDFAELHHCANKTPENAVEIIKLYSNKIYDQRFVILLDQYVSEILIPVKTHSIVNLYELQEGMKLSKEIVTNSGIKLVPKGSTLTQSTIEKIQRISSSDPIIGRIYIAVQNEN